MRISSIELAAAVSNVHMSADEIEEESEDDYVNTNTVSHFTSGPEIKEKGLKFPSIPRPVLVVTTCWTVLIIIMALRIYYTSVLSVEIKQLKEENNNLIAEIEQLRPEKRKITGIIEEKGKLAGEIKQLREENQKLNATNLELKAENNNLSDTIQQLRGENQKLNTTNLELKANNYNLSDDIQQLREENQKLNTSNLELKAENNNLSDTIQQLRAGNYNCNSLEPSSVSPSPYNYTSSTHGYYRGRKKREAEPCPRGWLLFQSSCYMISNQSLLDIKTWDEARNDCRAMDADLVVVESPEQQDFIYKSGLDGTGTSGYWIGLRVHDGVFKWVNDSDLTQCFWLKPPVGNFSCVTSVKEANGWKSVSCDEENGWICQQNAS